MRIQCRFNVGSMYSKMEDKIIKKTIRRNSEKRKEKSRFAARFRRSQECEVFNEMGRLLPIDDKTVSQMDKASVVRIAINYLKIRELINAFKDCASFDNENNKLNDIANCSLMTPMDGFILVLSKDGEMIYISENVVQYLGISQTDLMGHSIYDFSHPCDHNDIKEILSLKPKSELVCLTNNFQPQEAITKFPCTCFVRMKCTLTSKGRNCNLKSASYKVIRCNGSILDFKLNQIGDISSIGSQISSSIVSNPKLCLVTYCQPLDHPCNIEKPLEHHTFITRHSMDMKFIYVDENIKQIIGYEQEDLIGESFYKYFHGLDLPQLNGFCKRLLEKGQCETHYYRFLAKFGGYIWLLTQATLVKDNLSNNQCIVCIHYVISGIENPNEIISQDQEQVCCNNVALSRQNELLCMTNEVFLPNQGNNNSTTISSTKNIFAPRTAEMDQGFLMFTDESGLTVLPDNEVDPIDLTHLAPQAGDVCVPLDVNGILDIFDEMFMDQNANVNSLVEDDKANKTQNNDVSSIFSNENNIFSHSLVTNDVYKKFINNNPDSDLVNFKVTNNNYNNEKDSLNENELIQNLLNNSNGKIKEINDFGGHSPLNNDPFLSYQEDLFSGSPSSVSSSDPYSSSKSNSPTNLSPTLNENNSNLKQPSWDVSKLNLVDSSSSSSLDEEILNEDFSIREPYISIDEYPLLLNDDLSSTNIDDIINSDSSKNNFTNNNINNNNQGKIGDNLESNHASSNLAMLLQTDLTRRNMINECINKKKVQISNRNKAYSSSNNKLGNESDFQFLKNYNHHPNLNHSNSMNNVKNNFHNYDNQKMNLQNYEFVTAYNDKSMQNQQKQQNNLPGNMNLNVSQKWTNRNLQQTNYQLKRPFPRESLDNSLNNNVKMSEQMSNQIMKTNVQTKRMKTNISQLKNSGTSVLMNLLVNGEDASNGYSKYSNHNNYNYQTPNLNGQTMQFLLSEQSAVRQTKKNDVS